MDEDEEQTPCIIRLDAKEREEYQQKGKLLSKWLIIAVYSIFLFGGQILATFLGRQYFDHGGKSKWMATLVQNAGFPVAIPFLLIRNSRNPANIKPSMFILAGIYVILGVFLAGDSMLFSIGLQYLPVSTYTLIVATQLGFNALFSAILKLENLTVYVINSVVLLGISSAILVLDHDGPGPGHTHTLSVSATNDEYVVGFICTLIGSAGYALMLSLTQLAFKTVIKTHTFKAVLDMSIYQCLVATVVTLIGLFASGEWKSLPTEIKDSGKGIGFYASNLVWTAVFWQVFTVGNIGLIFKVTSLFSNAISLVGVPVAPVFAVIFYHDKMTGAKVISMLLAIWGFMSYIYQNYLDELEEDKEQREATTSEASPILTINLS